MKRDKLTHKERLHRERQQLAGDMAELRRLERMFEAARIKLDERRKLIEFLSDVCEGE